MATLSPSNPHPQRAPPPSLFLGPPSRNASAVSLINPPTGSTTTPNKPGRAPLLRSRSARGHDLSSSSPLRHTNRPQVSTTQTEGDRTDALWAEMQATLADIEVSAFSSTHVFGATHAEALEELRAAQIGLAQAWGKDVGGPSGEKGEDGGAKEERGEDDDADEGDILVARRRREANERFFEKVREGVRDVVGRLEEVADAMGKVERESRDIWSSSGSCESVASGSANS